MEIPWLDMLVTFAAQHADAALARIRTESLGRVDDSYGSHGILTTGNIAHIRIYGSLAFVDVYETLPGYLAWEPVTRLRLHAEAGPLEACEEEYEDPYGPLQGCEESGDPDD